MRGGALRRGALLEHRSEHEVIADSLVACLRLDWREAAVRRSGYSYQSLVVMARRVGVKLSTLSNEDVLGLVRNHLVQLRKRQNRKGIQ